jgi:uncharacterized protein (DUF1015 family)
MAHLSPFRATRYDTSKVRPEDVVAPPYDVVGPTERAALSARSPYNAIHVELPDPALEEQRYEEAARIFSSWHESGVVAVDEVPSLYCYRMSFFAEDGTRRTTTGVLGALGLDLEKRGDVLPHEETTSKDKSDRLSLLEAARTNFSPIWGLSLAEGFGSLCEKAVADTPAPFAAHDEAGALHECWPVSDPGFLEAAVSKVATAPVLIADGHHRYETACEFAAHDTSPGAQAVLALVIELSEQQLNVEAIYRLVTGVEPEALAAHLEGSFEVRPGPGEAAFLREEMKTAGALGLLSRDRGWLLVPQDEGDELDSVRLRRAIEGLEGAKVSYQHGLEEVSAALVEQRASAAVLIRPVSVPQIAATAHGGRRMPPKSTFFYPKLLTGMVFRELEAG